MRRVEDRLHDALVAVETELVNAQGQNDRNREAPQEAVEAQQDGVFHHAGERGRGEEPLEPLEAHELAAQVAPAGLEIAEGDLKPVHGDILVNQRGIISRAYNCQLSAIFWGKVLARVAPFKFSHSFSVFRADA